MARLPNFLVIIRSEKLSGKGLGRGAKKRTFRFGKKNVSFPKVETFRFADYTGVLSLAYYFNKKVLASTIPFFEDNATLNVVLFKVNDIDDLERKMKSLIFGKNLSVDPTSYLNIYGEGTLINSYWGLYED